MSNKLTEFGEIKFHKNYRGDYSWPSNDYFCNAPFRQLEIKLNGDVTVCCPLWNPLIVGNVLSEDIVNIWNNEKVMAVRKSVTDGTYTWCDQYNCPYIQQHGNLNGPVFPKTHKKYQETISNVSKYPSNIHFVIDLSCNLSCPSCRTDRINRMSDAEINKSLVVVRHILDSLFKEPHQEEIHIGMDGRGEVFHSEVWREIFDTHPAFTEIEKWPNLKFNVDTNGTMLTPKYQEKYKHILNRVSMISISVDAGNKDTYDLVRREGDWDQLWINLRELHNNFLIKMPPTTRWCWNLIIQKNNFRSIPEFVKLAKSFAKRPRLNYTNILDWGKLGDSYPDHAVWRPDHPDYQELQSILNQPDVKYYRC
jgi:MoaA/NifB/PqqE/SkfB family radical SAM enzyme